MSGTESLVLTPGARRGRVAAPPSKSCQHRLMLADFLAGGERWRRADASDSADVLATRRCLAALAEGGPSPALDCGESGATRRFLAPVAAARGQTPAWKCAGRLAERPAIAYPAPLRAGVHALRGDVSSQFVTGLLFALPLLAEDSEIRFDSPLESRGYVDLTLRVLAASGVRVEETPRGFLVPGAQRYSPPNLAPEGDWSGAAFWFAMNALGSSVEVTGLDAESAQPDRAIGTMLGRLGGTVDVRACPDLFPALAAVAGCRGDETAFTGIGRLRLKESDRVAAMGDALTRFGARVRETDGVFSVRGTGGAVRGGEFRTHGDHRIAFAIAVGATRATDAVTLDDARCAAKSYPGFFGEFARLARGKLEGVDG